MRTSVQITAALVLISIATVSCFRHPLTGEQMEQIITTEVPIGSDVSSVMNFLNGRHIEHSDLVPLNEVNRHPDTLFEDPKLDPVRDRIRGYVGGLMRDVGGPGILTRWDIAIRFYFDGGGKVVAHQAHKIGTSF